MFKKMLLFVICLALLIPAARAETTLRVGAGYLPEEYMAYPDAGIELVEDYQGFSDIASAYAAQNDQIDLFELGAPEGLFSVKRHGYFAPLNGSETLMRKLEGLYEPFRRLLTTDDGQMVGWVISADILCMEVDWDILDEVGLAAPETFDELLDACEALADSDAVPSGYSLLGDTQYSRQGVMDLYMDQYIRASQQQGGTVDFTLPSFARTAERIRSTVPESDPAYANGWPDNGVFNIPWGYNDPDADMIAIPTVLEGKKGGMESYTTLLIVNPYSANRDAAIAYLEWLAASRPNYTIDGSLTEPMKGEWLLAETAEVSEQIAALEAIDDPNPEQTDELDTLRQRRNQLENSWTISPEAIARYRELVGGLYIREASPVTYDDTLKTAAQRFLNGAFNAEEFAKECQNHITMIYQEYGIPMN